MASGCSRLGMATSGLGVVGGNSTAMGHPEPAGPASNSRGNGQRQNSASGMMMGIGTPRSQSNMERPRPMTVLLGRSTTQYVSHAKSVPVGAAFDGGKAGGQGAEKHRGDQP